MTKQTTIVVTITSRINLYLQIVTASLSSSSSRQSTMSSGSVDLLSYQDALENVLTWLLEAEEVVEIQKPIASEVTAVKKQFGEHEVRIDSFGSDGFFFCQKMLIFSFFENMMCVFIGILH